MVENPFIGRQFAGFKITEFLGKGGMGVVMKAVREEDDTVAAVKLIQEHEAKDAQFIARFEREAEVLMSLEHPNILKVYDHGKDETGVYYIILEYVDGPSVGDVIKDYGRIPPAQALSIILDTSKALHSGHTQNVIHRDIKPDNILLTQEGKVRLADFGLAKDTSDNDRLTLTGQVMGTPAFMSPEQGQGDKVDFRTDIYSLGATLYYMLAGERPFSGSTPLEVVVKQIQDPPPPLKDKVPGIPPRLYALVDAMLEKAPRDRPENHQEVVETIVEIAREAGWSLSGPGAMEGSDSFDVTLDDAAALAGMVRQAIASEKTVDTMPADHAGRVEKIDSEEMIGDAGDERVGQVVGGKYEIRSKLGEGGMGAVYLVRHTDLQQDFALKLLHGHIATDPGFRERFLREAKAATAFTHKHAIQIRDFGHDGDALYMTMDFSRGRSLKSILDKDGALPEVRTAKITHQILMALREAHTAGLIHRDLKPENVMIEPRSGEDFVRILDFGVAKLVGDSSDMAGTQAPTLTRTGTVVGTVQYMSPEQASGDPDIDARSDLYSLAAMMFECISGKRHIEAANMQQMLFRLATEDPPPLSSHVKGVSKKLEKIVMKNLSRERGKRSHTAAEFLGELEACSDFLQSTVAIKRTGVPMVVPIAVGVLAAVAAIIVLLLANPFSGKDGPSPSTTPGHTTEDQDKKKKEEYERLKKLGDEEKAKGVFEKAKEFYVEARDQRETEEITALIRECSYTIALGAYELARGEKDYGGALDHILIAKNNAPSGQEKRKAEKLESELQAILDKAERLYGEAKGLDDGKKYLLAMPKYGAYIADYPKGEHVDAAKSRYEELEKLTKSFQGLLVKSAPPGADVLLGGKKIGRTPVMFKEIQAGKHTLRIEHEGFKPLEKEIIYEGKRLTLDEKLTREVFGVVSVRAANTTVVVYLDGIRSGRTPQTIDRIVPGRHKLKYVGPDEVTYLEEIVVGAEKTLKVQVDFQALLRKERDTFARLRKGTTLLETRAIHDEFTKIYPNGENTPKALKIIGDLDAIEEEFKALQSEETPRRKLTLAESFLGRYDGQPYPRGWYLDEVKKVTTGIVSSLEEAAYKAIFAEKTFSGRRRAAQDYLNGFPRSARTAQVEDFRRSNETEEALYLAIGREFSFGGKKQKAGKYVQDYAGGLKIDEVKKVLADLVEREETAFKGFLANKDPEKTITTGEAFLGEFKGSGHAQAVNGKVTGAKAEKRAFEATAASVGACDDYLKGYPKGWYRDAVQARRDRFGWVKGDGVATFQGKLPKSVLRGKKPGEYNNRWDDAIMVYVPAGFFPMGTNDFYGGDEDGPEVTVYLSAFFLDKYEVTNDRYKKFLEWWEKAADKRKFSHPDEPPGHDHTPAFWDDPTCNQPDQPVVGVDWFNAWAYARWAGKFLPTEAQWEKAASCNVVARRKSKYPWGDQAPDGDLCAFDGRTDQSSSVNDHPGGISPFGAFNLSGNVAEWCLDAWESDVHEKLAEKYPKDDKSWAVNPLQEGPSDGPHAVRGGSWEDDEDDLIVTRRRKGSKRSRTLGFRCASWHLSGK